MMEINLRKGDNMQKEIKVKTIKEKDYTINIYEKVDRSIDFYKYFFTIDYDDEDINEHHKSTFYYDCLTDAIDEGIRKARKGY